jgi:plastocyanin
MRLRTATLLLVLTLAGCGSAGAPVKTTDTSVTITLDDYTIRPQELRVPKGQRITVTVVNHGRLGHTFRIRSTNHVVRALTTIRPGQQATTTIKLAPGNYTMFCALANHEELGMRGKLTVG